ncbi:MAG: ParM/StbA family protein [Caldisericota bacterium]|nr:ParM/StbA family protein [Caldisericota bacterium]
MSATLSDTVISAAGIDVGFFATKFTCYRSAGAGKIGAIVADQFPSLAPRQAGLDIKLPNTDTVDAVEIEIEPNVSHLVGKDIDKLTHGFGTTAVTSDYSRSTAYKALFRGALHAIARANAVKGNMTIETLVAGLPLSSIHTHAAELREFMCREHRMPHPADKDRVLTVDIRNALVMGQPQGALMTYQVSKGKIDRSATTLVLDMGGGTFDWYVAVGTTPNPQRCGAAPIGALACATAICNKIDPNYKNSAQIMGRVDYALRTNAEAFKVSSTTHKLSQYRPVVRGVLTDAIEQMRKSVGNLQEMDAILFTGGAAPMLYEVCKEVLPAFKEVMVLDQEPVTSNVRGFHVWAEQFNAAKKGR